VDRGYSGCRTRPMAKKPGIRRKGAVRYQMIENALLELKVLPVGGGQNPASGSR
jgi:hypothetical protein